MKMKQDYWEIWFIFSMALFAVLGIIASVLPDWLWSIFNIWELLIGLFINLFICVYVGLKHTKL